VGHGRLGHARRRPRRRSLRTEDHQGDPGRSPAA
jgi:hypothetical protein